MTTSGLGGGWTHHLGDPVRLGPVGAVTGWLLVGAERHDPTEREALDGYVSGPDAHLEATSSALAAAEHARSLILVEGISDQIAVETLAARQGRDLAAAAVVVVPIGGAHAIARFLTQFGPDGAGYALSGLCDQGEEQFVRRALQAAGFDEVQTRTDMEQLGFFVCERDLEDELIRASGREAIESLLDAQGDLASFRTLQKQPAWRDQSFDAQIRRFFGAGARRKLRYANLLVGSLDLDRVPRPLNELVRRI